MNSNIAVFIIANIDITIVVYFYFIVRFTILINVYNLANIFIAVNTKFIIEKRIISLLFLAVCLVYRFIIDYFVRIGFLGLINTIRSFTPCPIFLTLAGLPIAFLAVRWLFPCSLHEIVLDRCDVIFLWIAVQLLLDNLWGEISHGLASSSVFVGRCLGLDGRWAGILVVADVEHVNGSGGPRTDLHHFALPLWLRVGRR